MSFGARALAIGVAVLLMLGSAHAQDETIQKMVRLWQGEVDVHDEPERTLVIKSVALERGQWIATIDYGPTGKSLSSLEARIERQLDTPTMTFAMSTTSKVELQLYSERELRGLLKISDGTGSWVIRKMTLRKAGEKP
jgi:hypothetical protein